MDRAIELFKRSGVGKFSISHFQVAEDNANEENEPTDFEASCIGNKDCYEKPVWIELFSRPELQPCPGRDSLTITPDHEPRKLNGPSVNPCVKVLLENGPAGQTAIEVVTKVSELEPENVSMPMEMNLMQVFAKKMKENSICAILVDVTTQFGKEKILTGHHSEILLIVMQTKSRQGIHGPISSCPTIRVGP